MSKKINLALVGATGLVGEAIVSFLDERKFPVAHFFPLASSHTAGQKLELNGKYHTVQDTAGFDFSQCDYAVFCAGEAVSAEYAPMATAAGCTVIDCSMQFADDDDVPMVVAEVNPQAVNEIGEGKIIVSPDAGIIQLLVALKPIYDAVGIDRINVVSYQAATAVGRAGMEELASQTIALLNMQDVKREVFAQQIAFNVLPQVGDEEENGYTDSEMKMCRASQKILADKDMVLNATILQAPVFFGHSQAVHIETGSKLGAEEARELLRQAPGVELAAKSGHYPTAVTDAAGQDAVFVGRIREDIADEYGLNLWLVADNVRRGAALNCVQILELLVKDHL